MDYKPTALAIEIYSSKAIAGKELSLSSWCIASLYLYLFSTVIDFSFEKYSGSTGHMNSWYQWRNLQWGCQWWDPNSQPLHYKPSALAIKLYSSNVIAGKELSLSSWCISIIIYLSFLNCDWLLIREVRWLYWAQELLVPVEEFTVRMPMVRLKLATPGLQTQRSSHWTIQLKSYCWEGVEFIQLVYCIIIYLSFLNCDWLLIREVHWFYWTQELLAREENFSGRMPMVKLELATPGLQTQCSRHWAIQRISYCWEGVEFIQLVYCVIVCLSFLNCDWLLIREVQWLYCTQELLVPVEKFTVRIPMVRHELATLVIQSQSSRHWAIQLKIYCWEGVEFIQLVYCIITYFCFLKCDWLLIREVQWLYWTQELLVLVEKFTVRMPMVRLELPSLGLQTQSSRDWAKQHKSYSWEGVEFIQLVYCIIISLSFLNDDWLLIREVQWLYWTQ